MGKLVLLLHGWLGGPKSFGALNALLEADGHRVLPLFRKYETYPRRKTLEQLADDLEAAYRKEFGKAGSGAPLVIVAHSMGALLARVWMLRHYVERGTRPPVERVIECGAPRHGTYLAGFARMAIRLGLVPGTALARQMAAPSPFLWDLAAAELRYAERWPQIVALAGITGRRTALASLVGGEESDEVVPAICSQPNAVFLRPGQAPRRLPERPFLTFAGYRHTGPKGILSHLKADAGRHGGSPVGVQVRGSVWESPAVSLLQKHGPQSPLRRSLLVARFDRLAGRSLVTHGHPEGLPFKPVAVHYAGLALFLFEGCPPGARAPFPFSVRLDSKEWTAEELGMPEGMTAGEVAYLDLRT